MLPIKDLRPHPDNPRKNLGDLKELTESIRKNGIMQNLTVIEGHYKKGELVPGKYTIIIGHRRCAAAHEAGLKELPCMVVEMDMQQQLCTMMEENMQREDLSVAEQAYGFQYMFDLGVSVEEIAKRTGFAESTVKHRLENAKLDKDVLKKVSDPNGEWQVTIKELIQLEQVKDINKRNEILKASYNSADLGARITGAVKEQERAKVREKWEAIFEKNDIPKGKKGTNRWGSEWDTVKYIDLDEKKVPKSFNIRKDYPEDVLCWIEEWSSLYILKQRNEEKMQETVNEYQEKQKELKKTKKQLEAAVAEAIKEMRIFASRGGYFGSLNPQLPEEEMIKELWGLFVETKSTIGFNSLAVISDKKYAWEVDWEEKNEYREELVKRPISDQMLVYLSNEWNSISIVDYDATYKKASGETIMLIYNKLRELYGFHMYKPELEKAIDGTHELYRKKDPDETEL